MKVRLWILALGILLGLTAIMIRDRFFYPDVNAMHDLHPKDLPMNEATEKSGETDWRAVSDAEWRERLSPEVYRVTRQKGTERARSGPYWDSKAKGVYHCICCDASLFDSETKFASGTGWPSFWAPVTNTAVETEQDRSLFMTRTEVHCRRCGAHLGHVFNDAPQTPTGLRYCINSVSLRLEESPSQ